MKCALFLIIPILFVGCTKSPPCNLPIKEREEEVKVSNLLPATLPTVEGTQPRSINLSFYPKNPGRAIHKRVQNNESTTKVIAGEYEVLIYTSDFYDLDGIYYRGMEKIETAEAYARVTTTIPNITIEEPDPLFSAYIDNYRICEESQPSAAAALNPLVFNYKIEIEAEGLQYVKGVFAKITGLYTSVFLNNGAHREQEQSEMVVEMRKETSKVTGSFRCFGSHQRADIQHKITLIFTNDTGGAKTIELNDLTKEIKCLPKGGVIPINQKIVIKGEGSDDGFNPDMIDWEDTEITLPVK